MKRFIPQTMLGRTVIIVLGCVILLQIVAGILHYKQWLDFSERAERSQLIERVTNYVQLMNSLSPLQRGLVIRRNQASGMEVWMSEQSPIPYVQDWFGIEPYVRDRLIESLEIKEPLKVRVKDHLDHHHVGNTKDLPFKLKYNRKSPRLFISLQLDDQNWLNMRLRYNPSRLDRFFPALGPLVLLTVFIGVITFFIMKWANKPLVRMAKAAEQFGLDVNASPMPLEGPKEVREASQAFNQMQTRLRNFVKDRTQMLAASSHDLRTPITRMRLRAEFIEDDDEREKMLNDLDEMEGMIKATMVFARDDVANEKIQQIDLAALVETLCADMGELGHDVSYQGADELNYLGRPTGLKRAVTNLIGNAIKYGKRCRVTLENTKTETVICVSDDGPGINPEEIENVFSPFTRLETSRNRETGGVGLGLAIVRSVAHAHGGKAILENRKDGSGLDAKLILPKQNI